MKETTKPQLIKDALGSGSNVGFCASVPFPGLALPLSLFPARHPFGRQRIHTQALHSAFMEFIFHDPQMKRHAQLFFALVLPKINSTLNITLSFIKYIP